MSADNFKQYITLIGSTPEPAIRSCRDTGQWIPYFDSCQLTNVRLKTPTPARRCEISQWCRWMDGQTDGHVTTKSLEWILQLFVAMGLYSGTLHVWDELRYHLFLKDRYYFQSSQSILEVACSRLQDSGAAVQ